MFLSQIPEIAYAHPWTQSFAERCAALLKGRPRVMYFYERPDTSTFRYRVHNMIEALPNAVPGASAAWFGLDDLPAMEALLPHADVLVLCRTRYSAPVAAMVVRARAHGLAVLFDVDDLVFDDRYVHLILETLDQRVSDAAFDHWFGYIGRMGAALRLCDGAIVTNPVLAERVRDFCGLPAAVVPNFLNGQQLELSRKILGKKVESGFARDGRIHIGYFSGTPTHNRDFAIAADAIDGLLRADDRVVLRVVGFTEFRNAFAHHGKRVEAFPLQDFLNLQRLIGETELNLVPLQDNAFSNCKSELKVFEASAVGTISIASPTYTLSRAIRHGETGFIAAAQSWRQALEDAIAHLPAYAEMAGRAAAEATERFAPDRQGDALREALFGDWRPRPCR